MSRNPATCPPLDTPYGEGYSQGWRDCEKAMKERYGKDIAAADEATFLNSTTQNELSAVRERYQFLLKWRANLTNKSTEAHVLDKIEKKIGVEIAAEKGEGHD